MRHFYTSRNCLAVMRAVIVIVSLVLIGIIYHYIPMQNVVIASSLVIITAALIAVLIYLPLYLSSIKYTVTDTEIIKSSGVFLKFNQSIKHSSIQYTTVIKTPMSDKTGINMLILHVFGGQMSLPFLDLSAVREIILLSGSTGGEDV
ncbi:MAG TPA: PH domain-containing protein [Ruminococcus sp.]|nr:PH domain-containing protein [Ruminococcus sp.]